MELNEREVLVEVRQQIQDSIRNQTQIMSDLKEIFQRIEYESKIVSKIEGDLKTHLETTKLKNNEHDRRINDLERDCEQLSKDLTKEKEQLSKDLTKEKEDIVKAINKEEKARENFENGVKGSVKATKWTVGIMASIATIISVLILILNLNGTI